jgi:hypothetical protein
MKHLLFDQDGVIDNLLDSWQSRSINTKCDEIVLIGHPHVRFDGTQEQFKLVLHIVRMEVTRTVHPLSPVDKRPSAGKCTMDEDKRCEFKKVGGYCTYDPIDNPRCEFLGDYNGENEGDD